MFTIPLRALQIIWVCLKFRLDQLLPGRVPWFARGLFYIGRLIPAQGANRGERLRLACEALGPVFIKFGQLLSTRPDLVPTDIVTELNQLQDNVPPFDSDEFKALVTQALGSPIEAHFSHFEHEALASASIAQVHAATLNNGDSVVVKVVRPSIATVITKDMALMGWIARWLERWLSDGKRMRPVEVVEDYRHTIFDELDLQREAANASQLRRQFLGSPLLYIPDIYWDYTTRNMLVMERIYGIPITDIEALHAQNTDMERLSERAVEIFFTQVFEHNFFHADMHPGNIFVSKENPQFPQFIAVDLAIVGSLSKEDQYYLARNMIAMFRRDYRQVAELHLHSGWVPKETRINEFEAAIRSVCEPIFEKPLIEISFGTVLIKLFQTAQRFNMEVQPQLVLLQKTLLNIEGLGRQLYPQLDLWKTAHPFLERWLKQRFHPKTLMKELGRYGPEWMEKFPELPMAIFNSLEGVQRLNDMAPQLQQAAEQLANQQRRDKRRRKIAGLCIVIAAAATTIALPALAPALAQSLAAIPPLSWVLGAGALGIWLLR